MNRSDYIVCIAKLSRDKMC